LNSAHPSSCESPFKLPSATLPHIFLIPYNCTTASPTYFWLLFFFDIIQMLATALRTSSEIAVICKVNFLQEEIFINMKWRNERPGATQQCVVLKINRRVETWTIFAMSNFF
jgi:hypothetical protein